MRTLWNQVPDVATEDGSDAEQVTVPNVARTAFDALVRVTRDASREEDLLLGQVGVHAHGGNVHAKSFGRRGRRRSRRLSLLLWIPVVHPQTLRVS